MTDIIKGCHSMVKVPIVVKLACNNQIEILNLYIISLCDIFEPSSCHYRSLVVLAMVEDPPHFIVLTFVPHTCAAHCFAAGIRRS